MADRYMARRARWVLVVAIIGALSAGWLVVHRAEAGEVEKLDTSLKLIPDDAAFYSSMLRNREQVEAIAGSRAWAKLKAMPVVQMGLTMYKAQAADPESVPGKIEVALKDPQTRKLLDTAVDMLSAEIFLYGDQSFVDFMQLMQETYGSVQYGSAVAQITGQTEGLDEDKLQAKMLMAALSENPELLKVPNMVVGFKVSDKGRASEQLAMLHELGTAALEADPMMKGRLKKTSVGGHQYLTLSLDGKMIPWDEVPLDELKEMEPNEGDAEKLIARMKEMTLVVALGLRDDYLLLSVGSSTDCLAGLGQGKRLIDRPEFKPLEKFAGKRLASISYVSKPMMARLASSKQDIDDLLEAVEQVLPHTELTPEQQAQIRKDAAALAEDLKTMIPDPGALMAFEFLTERGVEGYRYDWTEHPELDGSKPLGLLQHTGGNPFLAVVGRGKNSPEDYDLLVKWLKVGWRYVQEYAVPQMPEHDRKEFEQFVELVQPLLKRMDKANRTMLIPALADGQVGFVLDAKLTSKQFIQALPPTEQPMPMIEPAVVLGVSDAKLLRASFREYQAVIHGVIDAIRQIDPGTIPDDYKIPNPKVTKSASGTIYGWSLPKEWGVDKRIVPNFGLSDSVAVFSASRKHTQRLLAATPLAVGGVLAHADRPLAVAAVFDWAGLVDAATPWVDLAVQKIIEETQPDVEEDVIRAQVHTVLEVLKVLRKVTSESYFEGDALVTHTLVEIRDIEE